MDTKTFLARVTAPTDSLVVATIRGGIFWNRGSFIDLDMAVQAIHRWDAEPDTTVYYSVGRFSGNSTADPSTGKIKHSRLQTQATFFKALALDLDCGADKPYPDANTGWAALKGALQIMGMPAPLLVSSGNGVHAYWPLTEQVTRDQWTIASIALRLALADHHVEIDTSKIHDPSMVLRPVGTHHKKQTPHKDVKCVRDCPDYDPIALFTVLKPWFTAAKSLAAQVGRSTRPAGKAPSSISAAILGSGNVILAPVLKKCLQLAAIARTGGVADAAGQPVLEPMWRATLGFAKYCNDPQDAVTVLAGGHQDFDLQSNMNKLSRWAGTGPTTCATFEQHCPSGCATCPYKGTITSPAQLTGEDVIKVEDPDTGVVAELEMPRGYLLDQQRIWREVEKEVESKDANGNVVLNVVKDREMVSNYPMYVTGVFTDHQQSEATATVAVQYPLGDWKEFAMPLSRLSSAGKEFADFMMNKMLYVPTQAAANSMRTYLMRYLEMVQAKTPAGGDFEQFGWQPDGSFLCGEQIVGSPSGATQRRLRGPAVRYGAFLRAKGSRDEWVKAMSLLDMPEATTVAAAVLVGTVGIIGKAAGNASFLLSIYSPNTTTGKTLSLLAANSTAGDPRPMLMGVTDTANAIYKIRGTLNHLPGTIDELTTLDPEAAIDLAYNLSSGREKLAMTRDREVREPATWDGPTLVTCNYSLHAKFDEVMTQNDPVRARTMEITQHDNTFVRLHGNEFHRLITDNHGWAFPELVEAILAAGGDRVVWDKGSAAFDRKFAFPFEPADRFYRTAIIGAWIMGTLGKKLGLFPFDVDRVVNDLLSYVTGGRESVAAHKQDAIDIVGQFLQEHNDQLIECREEYEPGGKGVERVLHPIPERAVARIKVVHSTTHPVMPGSVLAINVQSFKKWLLRSRDNLQRVTDELQAAGALVSERERVTLFKGCNRSNPGQAFCVVVNLNHPRFAAALNSAKARQPSQVALAVLQGGQN